MSAPVPPTDEFFVGWLPMPRIYTRFLRPLALALLLGASGFAIAAAFFQRDPGPGHWEADNVTTFDGLLVTEPYAMLRVPGSPPRTFLLVEEGKFGALPRCQQLLQEHRQGLPVRATGTLLQRAGRWMLELAPGTQGLRPLTPVEQATLIPQAWPRHMIQEQITLQGEVIDPKCYLGAMKPGGGKTHKACAALCLQGGIPPMFVTRDAQQHETFYLLTLKDGTPATQAVLPYVGDPITLSGRLEQQGDLLILRIDQASIRRR